MPEAALPVILQLEPVCSRAPYVHRPLRSRTHLGTHQTNGRPASPSSSANSLWFDSKNIMTVIRHALNSTLLALLCLTKPHYYQPGSNVDYIRAGFIAALPALLHRHRTTSRRTQPKTESEAQSAFLSNPHLLQGLINAWQCAGSISSGFSRSIWRPVRSAAQTIGEVRFAAGKMRLVRGRTGVGRLRLSAVLKTCR